MAFSRDALVVGGCGHVGLPLGLALADQGLAVAFLDVNPTTIDLVSSGRMPFLETGAEEVLQRFPARP